MNKRKEAWIILLYGNSSFPVQRAILNEATEQLQAGKCLWKTTGMVFALSNFFL